MVVVVFAFAILRKPLLVILATGFEEESLVGFRDVVDRVSGIGLKLLKAGVRAVPGFPEIGRRFFHSADVFEFVVTAHKVMFAKQRGMVTGVIKHGWQGGGGEGINTDPD